MELDPPPSEVREAARDWELYKLLLRTLEHHHTRWVDNYRVFLSFNALLLPAVTALFGYATRGNAQGLRVVVFLLCVLGVLVTGLALGLVKRIVIDTELRIVQMRRLEGVLSGMTLKPFREGRDFFFKKKDVEGLRQSKYCWKGIRASDAYFWSSVAMICYYVVLAIFSIAPSLFPVASG
jgi:hypothetical protein